MFYLTITRNGHSSPSKTADYDTREDAIEGAADFLEHEELETRDMVQADVWLVHIQERTA